MTATRDHLGNVLCPHGRPMACYECGEDYATDLDTPPPDRPMPTARSAWLGQHVDAGHTVHKDNGIDRCSCGAVLIQGSISLSEVAIFQPAEVCPCCRRPL